MTSNFELEMLAKLVHKDTIETAQKRRFTQSVKKLQCVTSDECNQFVIRERKLCHC